MKTELLAPAKDKETAFAAIDCGADAVYIGGTCFGARQNACNSLSDIKEVVDYAHKFWVKVYVTVNTILTDEELEAAVKLVTELDKLGVDAVLVQDMGLLKRLMESDLKIPVHASTQCDNRTLEKVRFFNDIGLSRVVLARELTLENIKEIHEKCPEIELEGFVHGALCVSYSGQCYLSQYIGGRSANRGECAQPCRKKYSILDDRNNVVAKDIYALCLKDFNASSHIKDMVENGIFSFKIEGRLKDVGYVKNVVSFYRQELDKCSEKISCGKSFIPFEPDTERSFNRGFTDYFLCGRTDCFNTLSPKSRGKYIGKAEMKGNTLFIRTGMDISAQDGLCYYTESDIDGFMVNKVEKTDKGCFIYPNKKIAIKNGTKIYRNLDSGLEKELLKQVKRKIGINVSVVNQNVKITDENGISVSVLLASTEKAKNSDKMNETFIKQFSKTGETDFYVNDFVTEGDIPFMPVSEINNLRRSALDELMKKRLAAYKREEQKHLNFSEYFQKELDYRANIHNKEAEEFYEKCGCKVNEYCPETKMPDRQIELMRTKHCIKYALNMCKSPMKLCLQDEKGTKFPLKFDCKNCEMAVMSPD